MLCLEEEIDLINLGGACAAPLPTTTDSDGSEVLATMSTSPRDMPQKQQQGKSLDLLSDLDISTNTTPSVDGQVGLKTEFSIRSTSQQPSKQPSSPKHAYSHPSRQAGEY